MRIVLERERQEKRAKRKEEREKKRGKGKEKRKGQREKRKEHREKKREKNRKATPGTSASEVLKNLKNLKYPSYVRRLSYGWHRPIALQYSYAKPAHGYVTNLLEH